MIRSVDDLSVILKDTLTSITMKNGISHQKQSPRFAGPAEEHRVPDRHRINGEIPSWDVATNRFTKLVRLLEEEDTVVHRALNYEPFTNAWASAAWSKLYRNDQQFCEWAQATALITFTATHWLDKKSRTPLPPITYFSRLQASKQARQKALSRALSDISKWATIRTVGSGGETSYPKVYLGLYLSSEVEQKLLKPVLRAHVNNSPIAELSAHGVERAIKIKNSPTHKSRLIHSLGEKIPGLESGDGIAGESISSKKIATLLNGGCWKPYRFGVNK